MPTNKNAQLRYQILDRCFSDFSRRYEIEDLIEKVNDKLYDLYGKEIGLRQIREDIKFMRDRMSYNAPIKAYKYDGKKCYYRYSDPNFSIFNNEMTSEEVSNLRSTIEMLGKYRGIPSNVWLEEVISNLEYRFGIKANSENVISFEQNEQLKGLEFLSDIIDSAVNHQPLQILYKTYGGKEIFTIIHPYHVKQYNNRWFLFGLEENEKYGNCICNKALDRIVSISRSTNVKFIPNTDIDFKEYFRDIIGVTRPNDDILVQNVLLKFAPERFPYIVSKPIHLSQEIIDKEEHVVRLCVKPNKELDSLILSFGAQVEVLEPLSLRKRIMEKITDYLKIYFSVQKECTVRI